MRDFMEVAAAAVAITAVCAIWLGVGYIIMHFVIKYW